MATNSVNVEDLLILLGDKEVTVYQLRKQLRSVEQEYEACKKSKVAPAATTTPDNVIPFAPRDKEN